VINRKYLVFFGPPCNSPNHIWRPALTDLQLHQTGGKVKCRWGKLAHKWKGEREVKVIGKGE